MKYCVVLYICLCRVRVEQLRSRCSALKYILVYCNDVHNIVEMDGVQIADKKVEHIQIFIYINTSTFMPQKSFLRAYASAQIAGHIPRVGP